MGGREGKNGERSGHWPAISRMSIRGGVTLDVTTGALVMQPGAMARTLNRSLVAGAVGVNRSDPEPNDGRARRVAHKRNAMRSCMIHCTGGETRNQKPETRNQKPETRRLRSAAISGFWFLVSDLIF